jgi:hypothetical protein
MSKRAYMEFRDKLEWEGGISGMLDYGWDDATGNKALDDAWRKLIEAYGEVTNLIATLDSKYDYESE